MIEYKAFELHSHTLHSDGQFTVPGLCRNAREYLYDGIALTDHNTMSGLEEATPELERETLPLVHGIEWTTFFGHMVVIGADEYVDWRFATPDTIDEYLRQIQTVNGVAGVAHPYAIGSPMCTGCHWKYRIKDWSLVNYIEVWSSPYPATRYENPMAFELWTKLLNKGYHIAASSGRDWHGPDDEPSEVHVAATYLGVEDGIINTITAREALRKGRTYVTAGPAMAVSLEVGGNAFSLGETAPAGDAKLTVTVDEKARRTNWERFGIQVREVRVVQAGEEVARAKTGKNAEFLLKTLPSWLRVELYGNYIGKEGQLLGFTSPIYLA